eukprot:Blabericola_migrator_1__7931@NODE_4065_length_1352_cov_46_446693_g2511_i0_p1_GENE_NODE_4065_length_1352_cov_46_446693_g2511_i0NODE_4065_length_1352_cov_46_446693_g2511_i0_p1_ORF_typecomplete_len150_score4_35_NODE_4065_length_1352_cov_46_446693_g2511_i06291078
MRNLCSVYLHYHLFRLPHRETFVKYASNMKIHRLRHPVSNGPSTTDTGVVCCSLLIVKGGLSSERWPNLEGEDIRAKTFSNQTHCTHIRRTHITRVCFKKNLFCPLTPWSAREREAPLLLRFVWVNGIFFEQLEAAWKRRWKVESMSAE